MLTHRDSDIDAFARGPLFCKQEAFQNKALRTSHLKPRFDAVPPQVAQAHYEKKGLPMMLCFQVYYHF